MEDAIRKVDGIIERHGECVLGGVMEQYLRVRKEDIVNELRERGYVIRRSCQVRDGYVVYPKRKRRTGPWMVIEAIGR